MAFTAEIVAARTAPIVHQHDRPVTDMTQNVSSDVVRVPIDPSPADRRSTSPASVRSGHDRGHRGIRGAVGGRIQAPPPGPSSRWFDRSCAATCVVDRWVRIGVRPRVWFPTA